MSEGYGAGGGHKRDYEEKKPRTVGQSDLASRKRQALRKRRGGAAEAPPSVETANTPTINQETEIIAPRDPPEGLWYCMPTKQV